MNADIPHVFACTKSVPMTPRTPPPPPPALLLVRYARTAHCRPLSMDVTKVVRKQSKRREKMDESKATKAEDGVDAEYEKNADTTSIVAEIVSVLEKRFWKW